MKNVFRMVAVLASAAFLSCGHNRMDKAKLVGRYCFTNRNNRDSLFLTADGGYVHKYFAHQQVFESTGIWTYDSIRNKITFEDFVFFNEEGADNPPGIWHSTIDVTKNNEVRLMYAPEHQMFYYKK